MDIHLVRLTSLAEGRCEVELFNSDTHETFIEECEHASIGTTGVNYRFGNFIMGGRGTAEEFRAINRVIRAFLDLARPNPSAPDAGPVE